MGETRKKKCLLIDDDDDDRLIFSSTINKYFPNFDLMTFSSYEKGKSVIETTDAKEDEIAVVFLDLNMPRINGLAALKEIRSDANKYDLPVVIYSTSNNPDDVNECLKAGATAFITKPSSIDELVLEIGNYLQA
jgi:CheY-like chemotaxis protein